MARPFPHTFDSDSSLTPQSAGSSANTPISYRTNVNRQKTTKWANAKTVDYGGDDWGDEDDFDLPPPPISKPTGLRQQGQALPTSQRVEVPVDNKKTYGQLPALPGAGNPRGRSNSFDADEERNFSNTTVRQPSPSDAQIAAPTAGPATRFSQITGQPSTRGPYGPPPLSISTQQSAPTGLRKANPVVSPVSESSHPDASQPETQSRSEVSSLPSSSFASPTSETRTPASDIQARRDYSPSAVPPPLATRVLPTSQGDSVASAPTAKFPARKSSLSQVSGPNLSGIVPPTQEAVTPKPWTAGRSSSPGAAGRSPTTPTGKSLPFVRPADIYRRAEEERQSMESGRPSMDSIMGPRPSDRSESPARSHIREKSSSDSLRANARHRTNFEGEEVSDSGRRLMPMLEPVRERKSEYGFEGVNIDDHTQQEMSQNDTPRESRAREVNNLDAEEVRRQSVSPKLPDLNRISGFGLDMFSDPKPEPERPTIKTAQEIASDDQEIDTSLRSQPSFGFRSVVHQAFDRSDDSSVPPTPASRSGDGVRRTDSESTGTAGISPIMSRVPSSANPDNRSRDFSTPSILEVVDEPSNLVEAGHNAAGVSEVITPQPQPVVRGFKPGHRRDISTPSPGNSPARTPDLARSIADPHGEDVVISDPSPTPSDDALQQSRPVAEREESFRPVLPGGWKSYATTDVGPQQGTPTSGSRSQTPIGGPRPLPEHSNDEDNSRTPAAPKSAATNAGLEIPPIDAALGGVSGTDPPKHESLTAAPLSQTSDIHDKLPTPDPAMAPSGNLYSRTELDPRLLPKLKQEPVETQLRPDVDNRAISAVSSTGPTSPPKDSSIQNPVDTGAEHDSQPSVPSKQEAVDQVEPAQRSESPNRPQVLPSLSMDTQPEDEENDRLRKEIVKSLSPKPSDASYDDTLLSDLPIDSSLNGQGRESTYLPSEYDNYWASTTEDVGAIPAPALSPAEENLKSEGLPAVAEPSSYMESDTSPIAPLNTGKTAQLSSGPSKPALEHRFSWERSSENVTRQQSLELNSKNVPTSEALPHDATAAEDETAIELASPKVLLGPGGPRTGHLFSETHTETVGDAMPDSKSDSISHALENSKNDHVGKEVAFTAGGGVVGVGTGLLLSSELEKQGRRPSLAEEKETQVSSYPSPPEDEHPARSPHPYFAVPDEQLSHPLPIPVSPTTSSLKPQTTQTGRILAFKEIAALKTQQERIQTFDETRHRYAAMDSGLSDWIATLRAQHPEHADTSGSWGPTRFSAPSGSTRSKFSKATGAGAPPLQQPYYQQYLNASSPTTPSTPASRPGPGMSTGGSQQGFSPAAGKTTGHQVQAKGKEFLHTAGIFGGKAGKAGKGLLAKGKNKLRGAGGGDKTSSPVKSKSDRRSSWGPSLTLSRSSGPPEPAVVQHQNSRTSQETQQALSTSRRSSSPPKLAVNTSGHPFEETSGALPTVISPISLQHEPITAPVFSEREHQSALQNGGDGQLGVPAPIPKVQPSWDPFDAVPIVEEEADHADEHPPSNMDRPQNTTEENNHLAPRDAEPRSERSNSNDTRYYSARASEEQNDLNEWVMVSPEPEPEPEPESQGQAPETPWKYG
ncbi:hypothetical protein G7Y89_g10873 [Cudoniella acicularis]|uniref:SWI-SNF chromatin-remodeling complex protein n=1 Tax=Cudoniella acicularis TaxID=354080 RepID=A0A8H4RE89_9HELO|nr:hypothetical protein G7Y89_g10873 [Cudoniella acicularis]